MTQIAAAPAPPAAPGERVPAPRARLPYIDGLRGVAMLMVLTYHCWVHTIRLPIPVRIGHWHLDVTAPLHLGYLGVHLFLVLSGFCLTYPLAQRAISGDAAAMRLDLRRFFHRRAWRILPPYYAALALFVLFPYLERAARAVLGGSGADVPGVTWGQVVSHVFMVHNFSLAWMGAINGSFWSLALEWQLYLVFPLLVWGFRRWGPIRTLAAVLLLTLAYRTWVWTWMFRTHQTQRLEIGYIYGYALPGRLFEFALGMMAAMAVANRKSPPRPGWCRRYLAGAVAFGLLGVGVTHRWSPFSPVTDVIWGLAFFCLVMYAGGRSESGGGWLEARPLVALGFISYSVYLIHEPLITRGYLALEGLHFSPVASLLLFEFGAAPLMIGLGWLFFHAVEARYLRRR